MVAMAAPGPAEALAAALATPDEDVQLYMQQRVLPALTPVLEALLNAAKEKGELLPEKKGDDHHSGPKHGDRGHTPPKKEEEKAAAGAAPAGEEKKKKKKPKKRVETMESEGGAKDEQAGAGAASEGGEATSTEDLPPKFNPLMFLAEGLREHAGETRRYKELFEKRLEEMRRKREEEIAAAKAQAEAEAAAAAAAAAEVADAVKDAVEDGGGEGGGGDGAAPAAAEEKPMGTGA